MKTEILLGIRDFQSIKEAKLKFPVGVTVITGPSGSGKTALFRGISSLIRNPPRAKFFIRQGAVRAAVALRLPKQPPIIWVREKDSAYYKIGEDIKTKLGVKGVHAVLPSFPLPAEDESGRLMNFHLEWDTLFPFKYTPSELFRLFEDVFDIADSAAIIKSIAEDETKFKTIIQAQVEKHADLASRVEEIKKNSLPEDQAGVRGLLSRIREVSSTLEQASKDLTASLRLEKVMSESAGLKPCELEFTLAEEHSNLTTVLAEVIKLNKSLELSGNLEEFKKDVSVLDCSETLEDLNTILRVERLIASSEGIDICRSDLTVIEESSRMEEDLERVRLLEEDGERLQASKNGKVKLLEELEQQQRAYKVCPLCDQEITHELCR